MLLPKMKSLFFALLLMIVPPTHAAQINLQAGETLTLKPQIETTVTCAAASGATTNAKKASGVAKCATSSDEPCKDMNVGDLCNRDDMRGSCVPKKTIRGLECNCLAF